MQKVLVMLVLPVLIVLKTVMRLVLTVVVLVMPAPHVLTVLKTVTRPVSALMAWPLNASHPGLADEFEPSRRTRHPRELVPRSRAGDAGS